MELKTIIAVISVAMTLFGYYFYFKDIFAGKTKPHAYSWLVWGLLTAIAFFGQISAGAGAGAWVTATTAVVSFVIVGLAVQRGEKNVTKGDQINLIGCFIAILLWLVTSTPLLSMLLITLIDFLGFLPTIRKSIHKPHEETLILYVFAGAKFALAMFALDNFSVITALYPMSLVMANWLFVVMLVVQRRRLEEKNKEKDDKKLH
jgi:hypothetical protein